jgi:putative peptidoglycan lipid II flippase
MFPYLVLVGLAALAMGALNARGRFFASALGPAVLNVGMIVGVVALSRVVDPPVAALALGVLAGGLGQLLVQLPSLRSVGLLVGPSRELGHPALARMAHLLLPAVFGLASVQVMVFVNTLLGSFLPSGSISVLYYADRVMEFPLGVFGIALASASLPVMARQAAAGDERALASTLNFALRMAVFVSVPATVGLVLMRVPIVRVLFERGRFEAADTLATAEALAWYALGLVGMAGARIAAQAFYAVAQPGTAVRLGFVSIVANVVAALLLVGPLGHAGLAAATSVGASVNLAGLLWAARRRFGPLGGRAIAASLLRTVAAAVPLAAWCAGAWAMWPLRASVVVEAIWLAVTMVVGVGLFWGASVLLGAPEREALRRHGPRTGAPR